MSESEENRSQASSSSTTSVDEDLRRSRKRKVPSREERKHKKSKVLEHLAEQVSQIQNYLSCGAFPPPSWYPYGLQHQPPVVTNIVDPSLGQDMSQSQSIIEAPAESPLDFEFNLTTNVKESSISKTSTDHLKLLNSLQHFNSEDWNNVRYSEIQKSYISRPGFIELEVNDEIKQFDKVNSLTGADRSFGAITHAMIMQSDALKTGVSQLLQWVNNSDSIDKETLLMKIKEIFSGDFQKISLDCLQLLCGRRADVIEQRRESILNLVKDKFLKSSLKKIPPSSDFLFSKDEFTEFLKNNGGVNKIFSRPSFSAQEKRVISGPRAAQPGPSNFKQTGRPMAPFAPRSQPLQGSVDLRPTSPARLELRAFLMTIRISKDFF
ncbi:hypothetical protein RR46_03381 [Papilio xuthus]|uniref:Uncharacterized protein n=1 Tax=Papilio xuthus TaxID=66420 RepID=A0A194QF63_PAPXU|nr:hypothetical protein RR46_03381 [Papilio xuthus]